MPKLLNPVPRGSLAVAISSALLALASPLLHAQDAIPQLTQVDEDAAGIRLDGRMDEGIWQNIPYIDGMRVVIPDTLAEPAYETHTRIFYTERGIYVGVMNYQPADSIVARMTSRDTRLERDGFVFNIDPSGEGLYGYMMRINLGGSMTDGTILPERQMNLQWDGSWDAETSEVDGGWSAEIFVPWSMISLPQVAADVRRMDRFYRRDLVFPGAARDGERVSLRVSQGRAAGHRAPHPDHLLPLCVHDVRCHQGRDHCAHGCGSVLASFFQHADFRDLESGFRQCGI